jgi:hypothetical protein
VAFIERFFGIDGFVIVKGARRAKSLLLTVIAVGIGRSLREFCLC